MNTSTKRIVIKTIADVSGVSEEELTPETYIADLDLDSLDCMNIQVQLCNILGISDNDETFFGTSNPFETIGDIINYVKEKL